MWNSWCLISKGPSRAPDPPDEPEPRYCIECEHAMVAKFNEHWFCELKYDAYMDDNAAGDTSRAIAAWYAATWVLDNLGNEDDIACARFKEQK